MTDLTIAATAGGTRQITAEQMPALGDTGPGGVRLAHEYRGGVEFRVTALAESVTLGTHWRTRVLEWSYTVTVSGPRQTPRGRDHAVQTGTAKWSSVGAVPEALRVALLGPAEMIARVRAQVADEGVPTP